MKYPYDKKTGEIKLPPELELEIANIVKSGDVVGAMRKVMDLTGAGLKISQEYVASIVFANKNSLDEAKATENAVITK